MKAVIQRVKNASITVDGIEIAKIGPGILTLLGICRGDDEAAAEKLISKICGLRIFEDPQGKMNLSVQDIQGEHLVISQFTLAGDCNSGRRPSFTGAETPVLAKALYEKAIEFSRGLGVRTSTGVFQADMKVSLLNDGPVTFILES